MSGTINSSRRLLCLLLTLTTIFFGMATNIHAATLMISTGEAYYTRIDNLYCAYIHYSVNSTAEYIVTAEVTDDAGNVCLTFAPQFRHAGPYSLTYLVPFAPLEMGIYHFNLCAVMPGGEEKTATYQFEVEDYRKNYADVFNIKCNTSQIIRSETYYQKTIFAYTDLPVGGTLMLEILDENDQVIRTTEYPITESSGTIIDYIDLSGMTTAVTYTGRYYILNGGRESNDTQFYFYPLNDDDY